VQRGRDDRQRAQAGGAAFGLRPSAYRNRATGMQQRHNQKKGFSLIEAAIVLAVVGGVIGAIWVAASNYLENQRVQKYATDFLTINQCIRNKFPRLQCDDVLCQDSNWTLRWAQTKFFDDIGCIPANIERRISSSGNTLYYAGLGKTFFVTIFEHSDDFLLKISIASKGATTLQQNNNTVSECTKLANSLAKSARPSELKFIQIGIYTYPHYKNLFLKIGQIFVLLEMGQL